MKASVTTFDLSQLILSPEQLQARTDGVHVSAIVKQLSNAVEGKQQGDFTEEQLNSFAVLGRLWEAQLSEALFKEPRYIRPGEVECDGIIGSPDCVDTEDWTLQEFKVTWQSLNDFEGKPKFRDYLWQIKSYCYMLGMCNARLIVLFVCGDWRPPVPRAFDWRLKFTTQELMEHWHMMQANIPRGRVQ